MSLMSKLFPNKGSQGGSGTPSTLIPGLKSGKTKQYAVLGILGALVYLGLYLIFATSGDSKPKQQAVDQQKVMTTHIAAAGESVDPRDRWMGTAGNKVADHDTRIAQQEQASKDLMSKFAAMQEELRTKGLAAAVPQPVPAVQPQPLVPPPLKQAPTGKQAQTGSPVPTPYPPGTPSEAAKGVTLPPPAIGGRSEPYIDPSVEIGHIHLAGGKTPRPTAGSAVAASPSSGTSGIGGARSETERMSGKTFLPVGFVRSKLLGGIYAPTGGQAQSNPMPVILRVKDLAVLPNQFRANVRDCMVVGASYGDLSAERAYVRVELLSCIRNDGQALEVKASGTVYDSDGKLGLRGRLISKQDKILMNALLAGVVGGIGQGVQQMSSIQTVTPLGNTVSTPQAGQEFRAGVGNGIGRALDRLANYQISLAEKIFPVIEVDSDREVDVAFTKGIDLPVPLPDMDGGSDDD